MTTFTTLQKEAVATLTERRSEFIAYVAPVTTEDEAALFIMKIKKRHADARHNVYAYVLRGGAVKRYSDDGEPQGSAGIPVLEVLSKNGLDGAVAVVTRYFGGILLGTGGLARAYSGAAAAAIAEAGTVTLESCTLLRIVCPYARYQDIQSLLSRFGAATEKSGFGEDVDITVCVSDAVRDDFLRALCDRTAGTVSAENVGTKMNASPAGR